MANLDTPEALTASAHQLGAELAAPGQSIEGAIGQLNVNLAVIGCEQAVSTLGIRGSWESHALQPYTPPFTRAVRAAAHAIIWRRDSVVEPELPDGVIMEELLENTTEGAVWIDPDASAFRDRIVGQNADLIKAVIGGLASEGYKPRQAKQDMREEFDEILDSLWTRGSYQSFPASRVVAGIMRQSGVRRPSSRLRTAKRFSGFSKKYGLGLAIQRLIPEQYLIDQG